MSEESAEHLVRLYLESQGYLVVTGRKFRIEPNVIPEVDIIAVHPKTNQRILGEVKAWKLGGRHFRKICEGDFKYTKEKGRVDRFKIVNDVDFRKKLVQAVEAEYGEGFKIHLYVGGVQPKFKEKIERFLENESIELVLMEKVIEKLVEGKQAYSKDPAIQLIVYLKKTYRF